MRVDSSVHPLLGWSFGNVQGSGHIEMTCGGGAAASLKQRQDLVDLRALRGDLGS